MSIKFEIKIPDEPFKNTFKLGKTCMCTYTGDQYVLIAVCSKTSRVEGVENTSDSIEKIDTSNLIQDGVTYHIIDVKKHPMIMSWLTHSYFNESIEPYTEELLTGEIYEHNYEQDVIGTLYKNEMPTYDHNTGTFSELSLIEPVMTQEEWHSFIDKKQNEVTEKIASNPDASEEWKKYRIYLEEFLDKYSEVDFWKIPFEPEPAD